jgi:lipopolysaccharide transport system permease protein
MDLLADLSRSRELAHNLTLRELRSKYKRSILGWSWSLLNPLATMAIYWLVFGVILDVEVPRGDPSGLDVFPLFLLCGLLPWTFLANGLIGGMESLVVNANLIKKVYFARSVLVVSTLASWAFSFLIELGVLAVVLLIAGNFVLPWLPLVALVMAMQTVFLLGLSLVLSVFNVYFRDTRHLIGIVLQLWFYLTPILYPVTLVPERQEVFGLDLPARAIYSVNPMVSFTDAYRSLLYDLRMPDLGDLGYLLVVSVLVLLIGARVFARLEGRLAEEL